MHCLHYFAMRAFAFSAAALLSLVDLATLQAAEPRFRPALIGNGPKALVNLIDTKKLMEKGQRDALLMLTCHVDRWGKIGPYMADERPGSELLKKEVERSVAASRFIPAVYNGERTDVLFTCTIIFVVRDGKPHLHIYANQNHGDLIRGNDFIAPQLVTNTPGWRAAQNDPYAAKLRMYHEVGTVELSVTVDANGNTRDLKVISENPPDFSLGTLTKHYLATAKFVPGFRNGHPVDCTFSFRLQLAALRGPLM
jgi:hypothetical protein